MISVQASNEEVNPQRDKRRYFEGNEKSGQVSKIQAVNSHAIEFKQSQF
jgi:hypothetical protein